MKIEILFTRKDVERVMAEHCRKQFKIDPTSVDVSLQPSVDEYVASVEGDYQPE